MSTILNTVMAIAATTGTAITAGSQLSKSFSASDDSTKRIRLALAAIFAGASALSVANSNIPGKYDWIFGTTSEESSVETFFEPEMKELPSLPSNPANPAHNIA